VWGESASLIAAFLVAISRFDVEMLLWGGYPNVIMLMLIHLTFYLFLQKVFSRPLSYRDRDLVGSDILDPFPQRSYIR